MKKIFKNKKGFTLVELLVVISIFLVLTALVLYKYSQFNSNLLITNTAYEIAIIMREAQVYGISAKESTASNFSSAYGVSFSEDSPSSFVFFADTDTGPGEGQYSIDDQLVDTYTLRQGNTISNICAEYTVGQAQLSRCFAQGGPPMDAVDITFLRPNPKARIKTFNGGAVVGPQEYERVILDIVSPKGRHKQVVIEQTGQISVRSVQ